MKDQEFTLLGLKIVIKYVDEVLVEDQWVFGTIEYIGDTNLISISTKDKDGNKISKESLRRTLRHELFHAILAKGQYHNACNDEPLVEWLALCTDLLYEQGLKI